MLTETTGRTLFRADWVEAVFLHYRVEPAALQPAIPFPLDLREGAAWVSLVAFTMNRLRPVPGGRLGAWLFQPLSPCRFLNVRTYVRCHGEPGIYFMKEWISNRLSVPLGPVSFGLPYGFGRLDYRHGAGRLAGEITARRGGGRLRYEAVRPAGLPPHHCAPGSRTEFLLERYAAFTQWAGLKRCFRIRHAPWAQQPLEPRVRDEGLLARTGAWSGRAELAGGHYSPGVWDVQIGWPCPIRAAAADPAAPPRGARCLPG